MAARRIQRRWKLHRTRKALRSLEKAGSLEATPEPPPHLTLVLTFPSLKAAEVELAFSLLQEEPEADDYKSQGATRNLRGELSEDWYREFSRQHRTAEAASNEETEARMAKQQASRNVEEEKKIATREMMIDEVTGRVDETREPTDSERRETKMMDQILRLEDQIKNREILSEAERLRMAKKASLWQCPGEEVPYQSRKSGKQDFSVKAIGEIVDETERRRKEVKEMRAYLMHPPMANRWRVRSSVREEACCDTQRECAQGFAEQCVVS